MEPEEINESEEKNPANIFLEVVVTIFLAAVFLFFFIKFLFF